MTLIRWNPALLSPHRDLVRLHDEMDRLFDGFLGGPPAPRGMFAPPVDIEETPEHFVLRADLPGMTQKDVKVSIMGDTITIRGERQGSQPGGGTVHRTERVTGTFERTFTLGSAVRADQVAATFRDGVLEVRIPKAEEARVREVEIKVG